MTDLWPDIDVKIVSPVSLLKYQASLLRQKTQGLLEGGIKSLSESDLITHEFLIIAPALERYTYVLFTAKHNAKLVYPVFVHFQPWEENALNEDGICIASSPDDLESALSRLLRSDHTKGILSSLIARINDANVQPSDSINKK